MRSPRRSVLPEEGMSQLGDFAVTNQPRSPIVYYFIEVRPNTNMNTRHDNHRPYPI